MQGYVGLEAGILSGTYTLFVIQSLGTKWLVKLHIERLRGGFPMVICIATVVSDGV